MDNLNPDLFNIIVHLLILVLLVWLTFELGKRYGYNKRYGETSSTKPHQRILVSYLIGILMGYYFSYYMLSKSVSYKVEEAYELGIQFEREQQRNTLIITNETIAEQLDSIKLYIRTK